MPPRLKYVAGTKEEFNQLEKNMNKLLDNYDINAEGTIHAEYNGPNSVCINAVGLSEGIKTISQKSPSLEGKLKSLNIPGGLLTLSIESTQYFVYLNLNKDK